MPTIPRRASQDRPLDEPVRLVPGKTRIPNALRQLRKRLHGDFQVRDVAKLIGCDPSDISTYEHGWVLPSLRRAFDLAAALCTNVEGLYPELAFCHRRTVNCRRERVLQGVEKRGGPRVLAPGQAVRMAPEP